MESMTRIIAVALITILTLPLVLLAIGQLGGLRGSVPDDLGVRDGKLKPPSSTENSASSQADLYPEHPMRAYAAIAPIKAGSNGAEVLARIAAILARTPGTVIVTQKPDYLYAQCSTQWLKFTDDVEFYFDASSGSIHMRSASRLGRKDFGANRARLEKVRSELAQSTSS
jgi:uncharacterized protein (DUF1499 family)